jgi:hypothetical protein
MLARHSLILSGALLVLGSCEGGATTSGREVTLHTALVADPELDGWFATESGWSVRLTRAAVSIGALYYFEGEPAFTRRAPDSIWQRFAALLGPSVARAHPGHYLQGRATGEMTEPSAVVLGTTPVALAPGRGITGHYRSGRFVLAEPGADGDSAGLDGNVAIAEGTATKGEQTVHFRLSATFGDVSRSVSEGQVNGCVFDEVEVQGDGGVTVTVEPRVWFNLVDFEDVAAGSEAEPTEVESGETAQLAFALGVVQLSAYRFSFQRDE